MAHQISTSCQRYTCYHDNIILVHMHNIIVYTRLILSEVHTSRVQWLPKLRDKYEHGRHVLFKHSCFLPILRNTETDISKRFQGMIVLIAHNSRILNLFQSKT